jgi:hypothetical protein
VKKEKIKKGCSKKEPKKKNFQIEKKFVFIKQKLSGLNNSNISKQK